MSALQVQRLMDRLEANLRAIAATATSYAPQLVERVAMWPDKLDEYAGRDFVILTRVGPERHEEEGTNQRVRAHAEVYLLLCKRFDASQLGKVAFCEAQNSALQGVLLSLWSDVTLAAGGNGQIAINVAQEPMEVDRWPPLVGGWACVEIVLFVDYAYSGATP